MYARENLRQELDAIFFSLEGQGRAIAKRDLTLPIIAKHRKFSGKDEDFAVYCIAATVSAEADKYIRECKEYLDKGTDPQMRFPGYEHLQKRYSISRGEGETSFVPIALMTDEELEWKAAEHDSQGEGHLAHAKEIRQYIRERQKKAQA